MPSFEASPCVWCSPKGKRPEDTGLSKEQGGVLALCMGHKSVGNLVESLRNLTWQMSLRVSNRSAREGADSIISRNWERDSSMRSITMHGGR